MAQETHGFALNQTMSRIRDPDAYWIEILSGKILAAIVSLWKSTWCRLHHRWRNWLP
jgi:hypothetical protein